MASERVAGFEELLVQMRVTNALLVALLQQRSRELHEPPLTQAQLARKMADAGAPAFEIAKILGTSVNTVQVTLSRDRQRQLRRDAK